MEKVNEKAIVDQARTRFLGISVDSEFYKKVKEVATRDGISAAQLLREAVAERVARAKK